MFRLIVTIGLLVLLMALASPAHSVLSNSEYEDRVQQRINIIRENHSLPPVSYGPCVDRLAEQWATFLDLSGLFHHQDLAPFLIQCNAVAAGEVLAKGPGRPRKIVRALMRSDTHRAVILKGNYDKIGVSVRRVPGGRIVVVDFIQRPAPDLL